MRVGGDEWLLAGHKKKVLLSQYLFTFSKKGTNTHVAVSALQDSSHWALEKWNGITQRMKATESCRPLQQ